MIVIIQKIFDESFLRTIAAQKYLEMPLRKRVSRAQQLLRRCGQRFIPRNRPRGMLVWS
jgi:hypothetical protein